MHTPPLGAHMQAPSPHTSANTGQPSSPLEAFEHEPLLFSRAAHQSVHNENGTAVPQAPQDSPLPAAYTMGNHPARTEAPRVASTPPDFPGAAESTAVPGSGHQPASFCVPKGLGLHGGTENGGCNSSSSSSSSSSRNSGGGDKLSICASSCAMRNSDMDLSSSSSRSNLGYAKSALSCSNSNSSNSSSRNTSYTESNRSHGGSWEDLTPSMAIRMLCALAELQHRDQGAVRWLTHHALKGTSRWPLLKTPQLPYLTWALAKLQVMEPGAWQSLVANIASSTHAPNAGQVWQPQQLTQV
ncbi:hypothetical protein DUNSADRAFT_18643 [Dunaliella salina]|nr:hypothetical protein DUNSADRAFT_18643 [Dunaliella salina]|eukprot:KAF5839765.1 hypothetical protein DUNSADRAFT_18643 [Dunaliella salina]